MKKRSGGKPQSRKSGKRRNTAQAAPVAALPRKAERAVASSGFIEALLPKLAPRSYVPSFTVTKPVFTVTRPPFTVTKSVASRPASTGSVFRSGPLRARTAALPGRYSSDERVALALLLAPFMIVAASLAGQQALRTMSLSAPAPIVVTSVDPRPAPAPLPPATRIAPTPAPLPIIAAPVPTAAPTVALPAPPVPPARQPRILVKPALPPLATLELPLSTIAAAPPIALPPPASEPALTEIAPPRTAALDPALQPSPALPQAVPSPEPPQPGDERPAPAIMLPPLAGIVGPETAPQCHAKPDLLTRATAMRLAASPVPGDPKRFGFALAAAARAQLDDLVIYNTRYVRIGFPNGDVSALFGVCTDVIVRAYRALDIDLQQLVQITRAGRGDPHIDHRRVDVLKRFFEKHGEVLAISDFAEDYRPGDIVTYYRPQNRTSTQHIAIVTDIIAPSGRPLIVHNRGWGTQLEDALFVDKITGHFRFAGFKPQPVVTAAAGAADGTAQASAGSRAIVAGKVAAAQRRQAPVPRP